MRRRRVLLDDGINSHPLGAIQTSDVLSNVQCNAVVVHNHCRFGDERFSIFSPSKGATSGSTA